MSKKQLMLDRINGCSEQIPAGFWFHFLENEKFQNYFEDNSIFDRNVAGHKQFSQEVQPDFIKLMSDGFFAYPNSQIIQSSSIRELTDIQPVGSDHPWITMQVELVKSQLAALSEEVATFYNIFAPATYYKFLFDENGDAPLARAIIEDPQAAKYVLDVIAEDIASLAQRVIVEGGATGIYFSVQNVQGAAMTPAHYRDIIQPSDLRVMHQAEQCSQYNILHICGYEGHENELSVYQAYPFPVVNWSIYTDDLSLKDGLTYFKDKVVLGGFDNRPTGILATGTKEEVLAHTRDILNSISGNRFILGADCTLPFGIDSQRIQWVKEAVAAYQSPQHSL